MKIGPFELQDIGRELHEPYAIASMRPWVDVGSVGTSTLEYLEGSFGSKPLGQLRRPGNFFDFTRYRPTAYFREGRREIALPNVAINYTALPSGKDAIFLHLMEPHMFGEAYVSYIVRVLEALGAREYILLGAMYDMVPHTKPLLVTGAASASDSQRRLDTLGVRASRYEGPTTITGLIIQEANSKGIETTSLIAHPPQYAPVDDDHAGRLALLELFSELCQVPLDLSSVGRQAEVQYQEISRAVASNPQLRRLVEQLEQSYGDRLRESPATQDEPRLSSEIERFLREMDSQL